MKIIAILSFLILPVLANAASTLVDSSHSTVPVVSAGYGVPGVPDLSETAYPMVPVPYMGMPYYPVLPMPYAGGYLMGAMPNVPGMFPMPLLMQAVEQLAISGVEVGAYPVCGHMAGASVTKSYPIVPTVLLDREIDITIKALRGSFKASMDGDLLLGASGTALRIGDKVYRPTIHSLDNVHHKVQDALCAMTGFASIKASWSDKAGGYEFNGFFKRPDAKLIKDKEKQRSTVQITFYPVK